VGRWKGKVERDGVDMIKVIYIYIYIYYENGIMKFTKNCLKVGSREGV
jgi:hypothetical protein